MAVTKRTRYEVLRRDNHTCRYCGASAPDATLTVDHVTPVALGGNDDPSNLVAACRDCNAGKASSAPDAPLVEDVKALDLRWAGAIRRVAAARSRAHKKREKYLCEFLNEWDGWHYGSQQKKLPLPESWESSVSRFYDLGVPMDDIRHCVRVACGNQNVSAHDSFRYFAGCVWRVVTDMQAAAKELLDGQEVKG